MRRAALPLAGLAAVALGGGCAGGAYALGYHAGYGTATAPATTESGATTSLTYREYAGPIGKWLLLILSAPTPPTGTSRVTSESTSCYGDYCQTTTTTEYTPPTAEQMAEFSERSREFATTVAPAILSGAIAVEVVIDLALPSLGGDTAGGAFYMNWRKQIRSLWPFEGMSLSFGLGFASYNLHDRTRDVLTDDGMGTLRLVPVTEDVGYSYYGTPVRLTGMLSKRLALYGQFDVNWQPWFASAFDSREQPQLVRAGAQLWLTHLYVTAEASADGFHVDRVTLSGEVGLAF